jgi:acyl carrier protein
VTQQEEGKKMSQPIPSESEILERFAKVVSKSLRIDPALVTPEADLELLGAESLDLLEISVDTESEFNICLPEKNILQTAEEVFGQGVLQKDGILTEDGKRLLLRRMPDLAPEQLQGAVKVSDLRRLFGKVSIWTRMIHGLMGYTPQTCPDCGNSGLEPALGSRLRCLQCGKECDIPSGEQLNARWIQEYYEKEYLPMQILCARGE